MSSFCTLLAQEGNIPHFWWIDYLSVMNPKKRETDQRVDVASFLRNVPAYIYIYFFLVCVAYKLNRRRYRVEVGKNGEKNGM